MNEQPVFYGISKESNRLTKGFGWCKSDYTEEFLKELGETEQDAYLYTDRGVVICYLNSMVQEVTK